MITAVVNFKLPADIDGGKAAELFKGSAPDIRYCETAVVVDNESGRILADAAERTMRPGGITWAHRDL